MERVTFKNSRQGTLVGHFHPADSNAVIILCHGFTSDKSSNGRFDRLTALYQAAGYNALAFDFSGCGESDDDTLTLAKEIDDLKAAMAYVRSRGCKRIGLHGHSLGTLVSLNAYTAEVETMVLTGALTGAMHYNWPEEFTPEQMQQLAREGVVAEVKTEGIRKINMIEQQMLDDFALVDQQALLSAVRCPVLIVHGDGEEEEVRLRELSRQGIRYLSPQSRLIEIEGADHSFMTHFSQVEALALDWVRQHFRI